VKQTLRHVYLEIMGTNCRGPKIRIWCNGKKYSLLNESAT